MRLVRAFVLGFATLSLWASTAAAQSQLPDDRQVTSVFFLGVSDPQKNYAVISYGTAFFISSNGHAVTASHVIDPFTRSPERYVLIALIGREFYGASVICAYPVPNVVRPTQGPFYRDIAEVSIETSHFPFRTWAFARDNPDLTYTPHEGPMPPFPPLWVASGAASGAVHIPGFGSVSGIPRLHVSRGTVTRAFQADGVPLIELSLTTPIQEGDGGAPILGTHGGVVGVLGRTDTAPAPHAYGISASVLASPCK